MHWQQRSVTLYGEEGIRRLRETHVAVVGLGGVGGTAALALARAGVGRLTVIDGDVVDPCLLYTSYCAWSGSAFCRCRTKRSSTRAILAPQRWRRRKRTIHLCCLLYTSRCV